MAQIYCEENVSFDLNTKDLFYVFIPKYKVFENQGFCFNPAYEVEFLSYDDSPHNRFLSARITKKENFVDLFLDDHINIKII